MLIMYFDVLNLYNFFFTFCVIHLALVHNDIWINRKGLKQTNYHFHLGQNYAELVNIKLWASCFKDTLYDQQSLEISL